MQINLTSAVFVFSVNGITHQVKFRGDEVIVSEHLLGNLLRLDNRTGEWSPIVAHARRVLDKALRGRKQEP